MRRDMEEVKITRVRSEGDMHSDVIDSPSCINHVVASQLVGKGYDSSMKRTPVNRAICIPCSRSVKIASSPTQVTSMRQS